jgi:hypothetical protein
MPLGIDRASPQEADGRRRLGRDAPWDIAAPEPVTVTAVSSSAVRERPVTRFLTVAEAAARDAWLQNSEIFARGVPGAAPRLWPGSPPPAPLGLRTGGGAVRTTAASRQAGNFIC